MEQPKNLRQARMEVTYEFSIRQYTELDLWEIPKKFVFGRSFFCPWALASSYGPFVYSVFYKEKQTPEEFVDELFKRLKNDLIKEWRVLAENPVFEKYGYPLLLYPNYVAFIKEDLFTAPTPDGFWWLEIVLHGYTQLKEGEALLFIKAIFEFCLKRKELNAEKLCVLTLERLLKDFLMRASVYMILRDEKCEESGIAYKIIGEERAYWLVADWLSVCKKEISKGCSKSDYTLGLLKEHCPDYIFLQKNNGDNDDYHTYVHI